MLIGSDIHFNIDNVSSSRPFVHQAKLKSPWAGGSVKTKGALERVSVHLWSVFSTVSPAKETCIVTENKLPAPPEVSRSMDVDMSPPTTTNTNTNTSSCQCSIWPLIVYVWLPSSVGGFEVLDCWQLQISCVCGFKKGIILLQGHLSTTDIRKCVRRGSQLKSRYDSTSLKRQVNMKSCHVSTTWSLSGLQQQTAQVGPRLYSSSSKGKQITWPRE